MRWASAWTSPALDLGVGEAVQLDGDAGPILAEVVALHDDVATCMPVSDLRGVRRGNRVVATGGPLMVPIGPACSGAWSTRLGRPIDGGPRAAATSYRPVSTASPRPP